MEETKEIKKIYCRYICTNRSVIRRYYGSTSLDKFTNYLMN